ncbi:MAG: tail fiber protein [bacterium]|nr:tail fiber protein [bacterium]
MKVEIFNKNGLRKSISAMMLALALALTGCEAGLQSGSSSSNGDDGDFSFSDMYSSITQLKDELASLKNTVDNLSGTQSSSSTGLQQSINALQTSVTDHENRLVVNEGLLQKAAPAGTIVPFGGGIIPDGWLLCDGSSKLRTDYSDLFQAIGTAWGTSDGSRFNLPDLQGYFLRGVNNGSGNDPDIGMRYARKTGGNSGDKVGSYQVDELGEHSHFLPNIRYVFSRKEGEGSSLILGIPEFETSSAGGNETRPKNAYVNYIIKK